MLAPSLTRSVAADESLGHAAPCGRGVIMIHSVLAVAAVVMGAGDQHGPLVKLETLLSATQYTGFEASPGGEHFAWIENSQGVRNVWVAPHGSAPRPITRFASDDGQVLSSLTMSRDASIVAFVRGGPTGPDGAAPDPLSSPSAAAKVEIWCWQKDRGAARFGDGHSPRLSPDGGTLAFVRGGKLFLAPVGAPDQAAALQLRGRATEVSWAPDGSALAFVSQRSTHSLVGVYSLGRRTVSWVSPGFSFDHRPTWSVDGRHLAFLRTPPLPPLSGFGGERTGPVEIWVADPGVGSASRAFRYEATSEDEAQDPEERALAWGAGDKLVFSWEQDGWLRLYALTPGGGEPVALSPAGCEARGARLTPDGRSVVFSANCGDPDRSHLWLASLEGGAPRALTSGSGIESHPAPGAHGVLFLQTSSANPGVPATVSLETGGSPHVLRPEALRDFPLDRMIEPEIVSIRAADGVETRAHLFRAPGVTGRRPAVVFVHGGPSRQMLLGWHPMGYYHRAYALNQHLASRGYIVLSVNYRGGVGYGREFRQNRDAWDGADYRDVVAAARYLQERPDVDGSRIAVWGGSHGGFLSALALARSSDVFAAGVDLAGMTSFIMDVTAWRSPVLIVHGDHDPTVPFAQSVELVRRLSQLPRPPDVETLMLPDEQHMYLRYATWLRVFERVAAFLDRRIGPGSSRSAGALHADLAE